MELEKIFGVDFGEPKEGDWSWFRLVFGLLYWSKCLCVLRLLITNRILEFRGTDL